MHALNWGYACVPPLSGVRYRRPRMHTPMVRRVHPNACLWYILHASDIKLMHMTNRDHARCASIWCLPLRSFLCKTPLLAKPAVSSKLLCNFSLFLLCLIVYTVCATYSPGCFCFFSTLILSKEARCCTCG